MDLVVFRHLLFKGGQYILDLVDYFGGGFIIYVMVIAETIAIFWVYGNSLVGYLHRTNLEILFVIISIY